MSTEMLLVILLISALILSWVGFVLLTGFLATITLKEKKELHYQIESLTAGLLARNTSEYRGLKDQAVRGQIQRATNDMSAGESDMEDMADVSELVPMEEMDESDFSNMYKNRHAE